MHNSAMLNSFRHHLQGILRKYGLNNLSLCLHALSVPKGTIWPAERLLLEVVYEIGRIHSES